MERFRNGDSDSLGIKILNNNTQDMDEFTTHKRWSSEFIH